MYRIEIPKDESIDSTIALLLGGYQFLPNRLRKYQSDIFETRIKTHHRSAGEQVTLTVMEETFAFSTKIISYEVPKAKFTISYKKTAP